ncbi:hypothetical protein [Lentzea sp. E54]|uniref:hypothetical protein n=1 Tax=Lentzea xerophila TaxID=3435883 RepID=UPI003DA23714
MSTPFGHGAVHTLDGDAHRRRWEVAVVGWPADHEVVLFDGASRALTVGVHRRAGVPPETN